MNTFVTLYIMHYIKKYVLKKQIINYNSFFYYFKIYFFTIKVLLSKQTNSSS